MASLLNWQARAACRAGARRCAAVPEASSKRCGNNPKRPRARTCRGSEGARRRRWTACVCGPEGTAAAAGFFISACEHPHSLSARTRRARTFHDGPGVASASTRMPTDGQGLHVHPRHGGSIGGRAGTGEAASGSAPVAHEKTKSTVLPSCVQRHRRDAAATAMHDQRGRWRHAMRAGAERRRRDGVRATTANGKAYDA